MLFDVRAPGRKRLIQFIYLVLAVVLVGGTILFGVGTGLPGIFGGGNNNGGGIDLAKQQREQLAKVEKQVAARPNDGPLLARLASLRYAAAISQLPDNIVGLTPAARAEMQKASSAWKRYLATNPNPIDPSLANKMTAIYAPDSLKQPSDWADAQAIVTEAAAADAKKLGQKPPVTVYLQLLTAQAAAKRTRQAKITADIARTLVPKSQSKELEAAIKTAEDPKASQAAAADGGTDAPKTVTVPEKTGKG